MKELFSSEEWSSLLEVPYLVFTYIAGIDGNTDKKEIDAFNQFCKARNRFNSKLLKEILPDNPSEYLKYHQSTDISKNTIKEKLRNVDLLLDLKADRSDSVSFKHHLIAMGRFVADSSGKMFSPKMSDEEEDAIHQIGKFIDIDAYKLFKTTMVDEILKHIE
ncbi:MAG: hypothetical protein A2X64_07130 [Ignavibacteria bacterium GWF2_33_9]|nr:MAG: hypothetical protein A2X64_07130 [Ignavibacteria bacterium GWF2_33_9]